MPRLAVVISLKSRLTPRPKHLIKASSIADILQPSMKVYGGFPWICTLHTIWMNDAPNPSLRKARSYILSRNSTVLQGANSTSVDCTSNVYQAGEATRVSYGAGCCSRVAVQEDFHCMSTSTKHNCLEFIHHIICNCLHHAIHFPHPVDLSAFPLH